jgi:dTDP-4-dehydrorhamnose 3,5-epimerase
MIFNETPLKDAFILEIEKREDERGFFGRIFCQDELASHHLTGNIAQANVSFNARKGTLRGMHFQIAPHQEAKFVRCTHGALYDVIIDLRPSSLTYKKWFAIELTQYSYQTLYVPAGFAHGFLTLADNTEILYLISNFYAPEFASGLRWNDPAFAIEWPFQPNVIADKDLQWPDFTRANLLNL